MYPLNVSLPAPAVGFAVASNAAEHAALTEAGYLPALVVKATKAPAKTEATPAA
jgi:hypothetical protein